MYRIPGGLFDSSKRPRKLQVCTWGDWFVGAPGLLLKVGFGELSMADLQAVDADLGDRVFVAHAKPHPIENYLNGPGASTRKSGPTTAPSGLAGWVFRRGLRPQRFYGWSGQLPPASLTGIARGAQVAVLPGRGPVWVDGEKLFKPGELVPLPWTDPLVEMLIVRPKEVIEALKLAVGPGGPTRVIDSPPEEPEEPGPRT
ncbi:MAG TPA: hypothetical protein VGS21_04375 [Acidimicrobiales bacterium]|nr:hypothetical protein [Acidimicrobiales bacterium]